MILQSFITHDNSHTRIDTFIKSGIDNNDELIHNLKQEKKSLMR